jgi:hypothetical protein
LVAVALDEVFYLDDCHMRSVLFDSVRRIDRTARVGANSGG